MTYHHGDDDRHCQARYALETVGGRALTFLGCLLKNNKL